MASSSLASQPPIQIRRLSLQQLHEWRSKIPTGELIRRLGGFATGAWALQRMPSERKGEVLYEERPIEMNANQVRAAIALLNKVMPDLQTVQMNVASNDLDQLTTDDLRARFRSIIAEAQTIDVDATIVNDNLLSLAPDVSENDLLAL